MPDQIAQDFLARLWELQAAAKLSNVALARRLGVSPGYISRLRTGNRPAEGISLSLALRAAEQFPDLRVFLSAALLTIKSPAPASTEGERR